MPKTTGASHVAEIKPGVRIIGAHSPITGYNTNAKAWAHLHEHGREVEQLGIPTISKADAWFAKWLR